MMLTDAIWPFLPPTPKVGLMGSNQGKPEIWLWLQFIIYCPTTKCLRRWGISEIDLEDPRSWIWEPLGSSWRVYEHAHPVNPSFSSVQSRSCVWLCDLMDCSTPGFPVHHQLLELSQTHVHQVVDAIQPSYPLLSPSPPAFNCSQHQGLFQWVSSSHQVAKVLEFQLQHHFNEYSKLISFRIDWFDLLAIQGTLKSLLQHHSSNASILLYYHWNSKPPLEPSLLPHPQPQHANTFKLDSCHVSVMGKVSFLHEFN